MSWITRWGDRTNDRAVANARAVKTTLSRLRVEREEVEQLLQEATPQSSGPPRPPM